ncbi:MAG: lysylphosphatidylglycerol synthase transmembrane domain-containing protein [Eubacteriales bacterium]|nr:lysylphosphatidylglycerol synthase transmembrane domain-containing protein [Eubacteriales bacterium]
MGKKRIMWSCASLLIAVLSVWLITLQSRSFSVEILLEQIEQMNKFWLCMAFVSTFGFIWFEGYALVRIVRRLGYASSGLQGTLYGAADVYFSAITPSASGGQPASAYFMMRDGMSGPAVTTALLLNLIMYSLALLTLGIPCLIFGEVVFVQMSWLSKLLIGIGGVVLVALTVIFYLLLFRAELLYGICNFFLKQLERVRLVRHGERRREKLNHTIHDYRLCAQMIAKNKGMLAEAFGLNVLQRLSQMGVSFMVFMALGRGLKQAVTAMVVQCFVALGSNSVPIPGGMGAADYLMLDGLKALVGSKADVNIQLLCRGITFYSSVLLGGIIVLVGYFVGKNKKNREKALC